MIIPGIPIKRITQAEIFCYNNFATKEKHKPQLKPKVKSGDMLIVTYQASLSTDFTIYLNHLFF